MKTLAGSVSVSRCSIQSNAALCINPSQFSVEFCDRFLMDWPLSSFSFLRVKRICPNRNLYRQAHKSGNKFSIKVLACIMSLRSLPVKINGIAFPKASAARWIFVERPLQWLWQTSWKSVYRRSSICRNCAEAIATANRSRLSTTRLLKSSDNPALRRAGFREKILRLAISFVIGDRLA